MITMSAHRPPVVTLCNNTVYFESCRNIKLLLFPPSHSVQMFCICGFSLCVLSLTLNHPPEVSVKLYNIEI